MPRSVCFCSTDEGHSDMTEHVIILIEFQRINGVTNQSWMEHIRFKDKKR